MAVEHLCYLHVTFWYKVGKRSRPVRSFIGPFVGEKSAKAFKCRVKATAKLAKSESRLAIEIARDVPLNAYVTWPGHVDGLRTIDSETHEEAFTPLVS